MKSFLQRDTNAGASFTQPKNISKNAGESINPAIAVSGNNVYVVWSDNTSGNSEILFAKNTPTGDFTVPKSIRNTEGTSENPAIAVSGNRVYVVWSDNTSGNSPDCSAAEPSQYQVWPPNHNIKSIDVVGVTDPDGDRVSIKIDRITQDEPTKLNRGDKSPDGKGIGTKTAKVRAERDGNGNGRVYEIIFTGSDKSGGFCSGSVFVGVPHNQNRDPIDSGQNYDSTLTKRVSDNNIHKVRSDTTSGNSEILLAMSTNSGGSFTQPKNLSKNAGESINPAIAVSGNKVSVVWSDNTSGNSQILFVKSNPTGGGFTDPKNISKSEGTSENPAIAVSGNNVYVGWSNSASNSEILFIKSPNGINFTDPENISNSEGTSENPVIVVSGNTVYVAWIDNTSNNNQVPIAVSENGGQNFSSPLIISNNGGDISNPQITVSGNNVSITWIDNSSGANKILIAVSSRRWR